MIKNFEISKYIFNERITKLSTRDEDVDAWLELNRFKLFNFNDDTYYTRFFVFKDVQYKITVSCNSKDCAKVHIQNCEVNDTFEEHIVFEKDESRVYRLCDSFVKGFRQLNIDLQDAERYSEYLYKVNG